MAGSRFSGGGKQTKANAGSQSRLNSYQLTLDNQQQARNAKAPPSLYKPDFSEMISGGAGCPGSVGQK